MTKRFRLPCRMSLYQGNGRPEKPNWMLDPDHATRNQWKSWKYWSHIWQCTPPWTDQEHVKQLKEIYNSCPDGWEVDHIVPLRGGIVSGLHVWWNLQHMPKEVNQHKSNNHWPDMPFEQLRLF